MYPVERARRKRMDEAEVKHGRIAMLAVLNCVEINQCVGCTR